MKNKKLEALLKHLKENEQDNYKASEIEALDDNDTFRILGSHWEYLVLTDEEADERAKEYILDSVWAFNPNFIIYHSEVLDNDEASEAVVKAIGEQCESGNEAMKKLIDDLDDFVDDAISEDGRGHFLSGYDGAEWEVDNYYIYRIN